MSEMKRAETLQELAQTFRAAIAEQPYAAMWSIVQEGVGDRITSGVKNPAFGTGATTIRGGGTVRFGNRNDQKLRAFMLCLNSPWLKPHFVRRALGVTWRLPVTCPPLQHHIGGRRSSTAPERHVQSNLDLGR